MEIRIYIFIAIITFLNLNVNARNIRKTNNHLHRENDMHDEYLAREEFPKGSQAALGEDANECKCQNGFCERNENGKMVCKCLSEWGQYSSASCKKCDCGKGINCTFVPGWFKDIKNCICTEGYKDVNGTCKADCSGQPCKNGGKCKVVSRDIACDCVAPYFGDFCEGRKCTQDGTCEYGEKCEVDKSECRCPYNNGAKVCENVPEDICLENFPNCISSEGNCKYLKNRTMICGCGEKYFNPMTQQCTEKCTEDETCEYGEQCEVDKGICRCPYNNGAKDCENVLDNICLENFPNCISSEGNCRYLKNRTMVCDCGEKYFHPVKQQCTDPCSPNPCRNRGVCIMRSGKVKCSCQDQFTGEKCERDRCAPNPCKNGGTCGIVNGNTTCFCRDSFTGTYCEKDVSNWDRLSRSVIFTTPGDSSSVSSHGTPTSEEYPTFSKKILTSTARSTRKEKTHFTNWDNKTSTVAYTVTPDACSIHNCMNGGICRVVNYRPQCFCPSPFAGEFCEKDPCKPNPCVNGGTCTIRNTTFRCNCNEPFTGDFCERDPCTEKPCQNGGTCLMSGYTYRCICKEAFDGDKCESSADNARYILILIVLSLMIATFIIHISCFLFRRCTSKS